MRIATFTDTSIRISSLVIALWLQSVAVMDRQDTFTDIYTRISSMVITLCLKSLAVMDRQDTFTDTSTRISSMLIALWLPWTNKPLSPLCGYVLQVGGSDTDIMHAMIQT